MYFIPLLTLAISPLTRATSFAVDLSAYAFVGIDYHICLDEKRRYLGACDTETGIILANLLLEP